MFIKIVLTDVKPNYVVKISCGGSWQNYANAAAVEDCAEEVHRARMEGIEPLCVFTGEEADLPDVRRIYQHSFVRIRTLDQFAEIVGALLQEELRKLWA